MLTVRAGDLTEGVVELWDFLIFTRGIGGGGGRVAFGGLDFTEGDKGFCCCSNDANDADNDEDNDGEGADNAEVSGTVGTLKISRAGFD